VKKFKEAHGYAADLQAAYDPDYIQASLLIREIREPKHD
jgi:hypothetical protein